MSTSGTVCGRVKYQYFPDGKSVSGSADDCPTTKSDVSSGSKGFSVWGFLTAGVVVATAVANLVM